VVVGADGDQQQPRRDLGGHSVCGVDASAFTKRGSLPSLSQVDARLRR
jgi:hypothetical protein